MKGNIAWYWAFRISRIGAYLYLALLVFSSICNLLNIPLDVVPHWIQVSTMISGIVCMIVAMFIKVEVEFGNKEGKQ